MLFCVQSYMDVQRPTYEAENRTIAGASLVVTDGKNGAVLQERWLVFHPASACPAVGPCRSG